MTTSLPHARHHYTYEEYLAYERDGALKHEFEAGEILAMAGGSPRQSALASRISAAPRKHAACRLHRIPVGYADPRSRYRKSHIPGCVDG
jgi:Uma2 family endonuclease